MYTKILPLQLLDTGIAEAQENMSLDVRFLGEIDPLGIPILHFYDWARPSLTVGHFIDVEKYLDLEKMAIHGLEMARRPTGGGIVFHIWDLAFSFLMPANHSACSANTLDNYKFVNEVVLEAVKEYLSLQDGVVLTPQHEPEMGPNCAHFCMARPTIYDVVYQGMKIAGAAQRRTKRGYLHQGTISLAFPHLGLLRSVLLSKEEVLLAMSNYSFAPLGRLWTSDTLKQARMDLKALLYQKFLIKLEYIKVPR